MQLPEPLDALTAGDRGVLATYLQPLHFSAGERLFREGDRGDSCYIIQEGDVRIELDAGNEIDTECVIGYAVRGSVLGELSMLDGLPRSAGAYAETNVTALRLASDAVDQLCRDHPKIGIDLMRALGRDASLKLRRNTERLTEFIAREAPDASVDEMVAKANAARRQFESWPEERVDSILLAIAKAVADQAEPLARATVNETKLGNVVDKTFKNTLASHAVCQSMLGKRGWGILTSGSAPGVTEIASPAGVVFGIIPVTNPVATAVFKLLISLKSRCALILSFHRACLGVGSAASEIMDRVLAERGAPANLLQWVRHRVSRAKTARFMSHTGVSLILATGGGGMVKAAYSSGTPALGVGPGNAPTYVASDADVEAAAQAIIMSKPFDNGLICGAEHNLVVDLSVCEAFVAALNRAGAAVLKADETIQFVTAAMTPDGCGFVPRICGQSAQAIADATGIHRNYPIKLLIVPAPPDAVDRGSALAGEKLAPVLSLFTISGEAEAFELCRRILEAHGTGHTAIIHTRSVERANRFGMEMPASRILVNSPGVQGVSGITTGLTPSFTLGCGTFGGNSTTDNVTYTNLQNIKRLAHLIDPEGAARVNR